MLELVHKKLPNFTVESRVLKFLTWWCKNLFYCISYAFVVLICCLFVLFFPVIISYVELYFIFEHLPFAINCLQNFLTYFLSTVFYLLLIWHVPRMIQQFILGLFLNIVFFIPYLTFFSVLTFYCFSYWKSFEEKYLLLKHQIYETCRKIQDDNKPNWQEKEEVLLPVVSKELYDEIREELLPYDENLFYLGVKMFCVFVFSFVILEIIHMLLALQMSGFIY